MNLEQVSQSISNPAVLTLADAPALKALSEKHPYAAVFSLLYLTALANGKSIDLDTALQQHAYRLNDRAQLYQLINSSGEVSADLVVTETPETIAETEETEPVIVFQEPVSEVIPEEKEEPADESIEFTPESETKESPEPVVEPTVSSDFETITEAFTLEQHFDISETEAPVVELQKEEQAEEIVPSEPEAEPASETDWTEHHEPGEKRSFTSWLKSTGQKPSEPTAKTPEKRKVDEIIEHFIKEEPTISRGKTEFFSPPKKAKESLDEETIPVSETLAKIYAAQGNYPKAIHVYHQLMLAFPEKKLLFAVRIEELKKKITS
ncbi:MAG: hypothetical protein A3D31_17745 [Candidatus Fluviicola riflensis]|nr:MAG: hypothetical protein CHH17_02685 [Candidatus Fluviicola riflensis]OGS76827.1 MAG: hypothetical protein A3D31_17745 [Candidatus Fluviicola riflensis]OGS81757.1 MAG: hypothetical protein A2724_15145 [Fluviicola sp. RIFCSPHIGHO2_01_FULL_43_53]OGS88556.1 MAG: hypothetical protein A3E30_07255 [Fluviicola sp. RIFCSPHIGHO2_12_FULL_43_24]